MFKFEKPYVEIEKFEIADVITTSCTDDEPDCEWDLGL